MRLTIVPSDKKIGVDGLFFGDIDLSSCVIPDNIHAFQWYETEGEVEFSGRPKPQNEIIYELPFWASACVNKWNEAKATQEAAILAAQQAAANATATTQS